MTRASKTTLNLRRANNPECQKCRNREVRKEVSEEDLCSKPSVHDGLVVRCVGDWAEQKIYRLVQYFGIFAKGMKNSWLGLNYVEICSGPGRCIVRSTAEEIDGTALAVLNHPSRDNLSKALFIDPTQCDVPFETVKKIVSVTQNVDLIINVSIGTDISRNLGQAVVDKSFLGVRKKDGQKELF